MTLATRDTLRRHGFSLDPSVRVVRLTTAEKQMVEIARALTVATRVVVMDEPTSMLSQAESEELFRIIRDLSHRAWPSSTFRTEWRSFARIADRVTILRDGRRVFSGEFAAVTTMDIVRYMVGREIKDLYPPRAAPTDDTALEVRGLSKGSKYRNISFFLRRGEVLGLAGLVGAGRTALAQGIFGLDPPDQGSVLLRGRKVAFRSSGDAIEAGLAYLTEDRKITSLFPHLSLVHNISIAALERVERGFVLRLKDEARACRSLIRKLDIRARSESEPVYRLSGGNQQKALIARWLFAGSGVLILDEPTQGVDLGARAEIYKLMKDIVGRGGAILMISSDLLELLGMSHRIAVMRRGEFVAELETQRTSQEEIMRHAALVQ